MKIISVNIWTVGVEDDSGYRSDVFERHINNQKRLYCQSSKCKSRNHYTCEHVRFVQSQNITIPDMPSLTQEEIDDILTY